MIYFIIIIIIYCNIKENYYPIKNEIKNMAFDEQM
jgi:hypothetical protein